MPTYAEVTDQIRSVDGASRFLGRREIKQLPDILGEDESVRRLVQGMYEDRVGLLVATERRLVFVSKGWFSLTVEDFPYGRISSTQYETGLLLGKLRIHASGNRSEITHVDKTQVRRFAEFVRAKITDLGAS